MDCESGEWFWGYRLAGRFRVVDALPFVGAAVGAAPGLVLSRDRDVTVGTVFGSGLLIGLGAAIGLAAGSVAWLLLPPHSHVDLFGHAHAPPPEACAGGLLEWVSPSS